MLPVDNPERLGMVIPLVLLVAAATASSFPSPSLHNVRGASPRETAMLQELVARSATARALAARIGSEAVVVYVEIRPRCHAVTARLGWPRRLRMPGSSASRSRPAHPDDLAALLAHELQHALEIARADVTRSDDLRRLYRAIGEDRAAAVAFETVAVQEVGARVRQELSRARLKRGPLRFWVPTEEVANSDSSR